MKKLLLSLGSAAAIIAPVVSVISCNKGGTGSNSSDKSAGTNTPNSGVQASEHKYPELTDSLRNEFEYGSSQDINNFWKSKGNDTQSRDKYFEQFKTHYNDKDFSQNYLVFDHGPSQWVAPYHEVYDYFHSLAPQKFSYLDK